ncbi:hypothetical protein BAQ53_06020 [Bacillus sp. B25(2016b)]|uniref:DUF1643 domain-containing protein n=1 Tax=Bacillus thuringiensis TaxID=1428 RepID=UPI000803CB90|nr:DUF1643 domain-containing protein [Bacillus thuringiensis]ANP80428.1 hypothetical protein BAQ53_06020 [Bacillus sp. B25(2016b)]
MVKYVDEHKVGKPICKKERIVDNDNLFIEKRELLKVELNKQGDKIVSVIMMNPSKADSNHSDSTVNKIIKKFYEASFQEVANDVKYVNILNLLPIYNPNNKELLNNMNTIILEFSSNYFLNILESNIMTIRKEIENSHYIVLAWGMPENFPLPLYFEQAAKVLKTLEHSNDNVYVFKMKSLKGEIYNLTKQFLNPPHPSKGDILDLVAVDVESPYRIVPRLRVE